MSVIAESLASRTSVPVWLVILLATGFGLGAGAVAVLIAVIGVISALAGNSNAVELISYLSGQ